MKRDKKTSTMAVRLDPATRRRLDALAKRQDRALSSILRLIVQDALDKEEKKEPK